MRVPLLTIFLLVFTSLMLYSQANVTLNIHHKLGVDDFVMGADVTNNINNTFDFSRLEYYIAEISLLHDGGQETLIQDLYMLVDASEETTQELGELAVTNVEAIRFHIGVDQGRNHSDPSSYASSHPLSPKFPSMHWGWTAGYRFGAFEGRSGANMSETWQIHALEDENYFQTEVALDLTAENNELVINLDADYIRSMEDVDLSNGPITHGGFGESIVALRNFQEHVFTASALVNNNEEVLTVKAVKLYPNPASTKESSIFIATDTEEMYQLSVANAQGQVIKQWNQVNSNTEVNLGLETAGFYFISLQQNGKVLRTEKLVVQ